MGGEGRGWNTSPLRRQRSAPRDEPRHPASGGGTGRGVGGGRDDSASLVGGLAVGAAVAVVQEREWLCLPGRVRGRRTARTILAQGDHGAGIEASASWNA